MRTHRTPKMHCPACGEMLDAMSGECGKPAPGVLSICCYCAQCLLVGEGFTLEPITFEEIERLLQKQPRDLRMIRASREMIFSRKSN